MAVKKLPPVEEEEADGPMDKVTAWRVECFEGMGFDGTTAMGLAADRTVNLYEVKSTLENGCSHKVAAHIYWSLNDV